MRLLSTQGKSPATMMVVVVATIGFLGLSVLQIIHLNSSIETNKQIFLQKVHLASSNIATTFLKDAEYSSMIETAAERVQNSESTKDPEMDGLFRAIIQPILEDHGIYLPYEYAVYVDKEKRDGYDFVMGDNGASLDFPLISCENPDKLGHGWASLTCAPVYSGRYHLALFFPDQDRHIFAQSGKALITSILFIVLLIGCFGYTLFIIRKQKKLSEIKNDFINNLTHEFKTPIASINLSANLLKRGGVELEVAKRTNYLNLIDQESKRLEGHVDKILQIAMLDSGNFTLEKEEIDIHEIINDVVSSMSLAIEQRKGEITLALDANQSIVKGDKTHLVNIIYNLVDNALKYTLKVPKIEIATSNESEGIKIAIKDNGVGIGEEIQKFIFDKFYRADTGDIHSVKGFGLGLSYVKKLVDAHQGKIQLSSKLDHGSEFFVYIPAIR